MAAVNFIALSQLLGQILQLQWVYWFYVSHVVAALTSYSYKCVMIVAVVVSELTVPKRTEANSDEVHKTDWPPSEDALANELQLPQSKSKLYLLLCASGPDC